MDLNSILQACLIHSKAVFGLRHHPSHLKRLALDTSTTSRISVTLELPPRFRDAIARQDLMARSARRSIGPAGGLPHLRASAFQSVTGSPPPPCGSTGSFSSAMFGSLSAPCGARLAGPCGPSDGSAPDRGTNKAARRAPWRLDSRCIWWSARVPTPLPAGYEPAARAVVLALRAGAGAFWRARVPCGF